MELELLLKEESEIKQKISTALTKLKEWFEAKIEIVKDKFSELKRLITDKLRNIDKTKKVSKSVEELGLKEGDSPTKLISKLKNLLTKAKKDSEDIVSNCKEGISSSVKGSGENASKCKENVVNGIKVLGVTVGLIGSCIAAGHLIFRGVAKSATTAINKNTLDISNKAAMDRYETSNADPNSDLLKNSTEYGKSISKNATHYVRSQKKNKL